ncbi:hypothetical protein Taro_020926 [Colocasia esculenta]|uniref:Uncharacterized protein n=1 Tax=Colocasia esculenta TaxID=4460 RepID=A0A843UXN3_COLES|nr:hypothetical protein [Colocasia esculenta]
MVDGPPPLEGRYCCVFSFCGSVGGRFCCRFSFCPICPSSMGVHSAVFFCSSRPTLWYFSLCPIPPPLWVFIDLILVCLSFLLFLWYIPLLFGVHSVFGGIWFRDTSVFANYPTSLPTITHYPLQQTKEDLVKLIDKPFPYKQQMDILCGKTIVRGSHFPGSTQDVDVDSRCSFGNDDNSTRQGFSAMGLDSQQVQSIDDDNFNPFDFPPLSQPPSYENTQTQNTPIEDEAISPDKRRTAQAQSSQSRKRRSKKSSELLTLAQYCQLNVQRMKLAKSLFPGYSSSIVSKEEEQYTIRECVSRLKTMVGYSQELLMRALPLFERASKRVVFMSLDEEDAMELTYSMVMLKEESLTHGCIIVQ